MAKAHNAERELVEERERLRITLSSIGEGVISTDADGNVTFLNPIAEKITGWSFKDAVGEPLPKVFNIVNEHTRKTVENPAIRALQDGIIVGLANHTILISRDGTERPIDDSASPMRDEAGNTIGSVLVFRDVTERKKAEEAQLRLASIVESSDDAIVSKSLDGIIKSWNAGAERIFGYASQEIIGQPVTLLIPQERIDEESQIISRLRLGHRIEHYETVRLKKDGRKIDVSLTISPLRNPQGDIIGASKIVHDITERKQTNDRLRAGEEKFRTLFESIDQGFCIIEMIFDTNNLPTDYRIVEMNSAFERHTGLKHATGKRIKELAPNLENFWFETYGRVAQTGEPVRFESDAADLNRYFDVYAFRLGAFESNRVAVLFSDITSRKQSEKAQERLLREVELERERLSELFQRAPSFMCVLRGPQHIIERVNDQYAQLVGHRAILGKPVRKALPEVEGQGFFELLDDVFRTGETFVGTDMPALLQRNPGDPLEGRILDLVYQPIRDADGVITGIFTQGIDITARKRAEDEVRLKTERLNLLVENTRDYAVIISDIDGLVIEWQGGAERITGYSSADAVGKKADLIFTAKDRATGKPQEEMRKAAQDGRAEDKRWHQHKNGTLFFADGVMIGLFDEHKMLRGYGKVFKDATGEELAKVGRREHAERLKKLAEVSTRLNAVLDLQSVLGVVTAEGRVLTKAHQAVTEIGPEPNDPIRSYSFSDELHKREGATDVVSRLVIYETLTQDNQTVRLTQKQLQEHVGWEKIRAIAESPPSLRGILATPIIGPSGNVLGVIQLSDKQEGEFSEEDEAILVQLAQMAAVAIENTRLYQALREADRKKDDFLALLAHELRNPLAPIRNGLQVLQLSRDHMERDQLQGMMNRQLSHMVRLIDDLLDISRINRNKMELRSSRILLADAISSAVETARPIIDAAGHQLTIEIPPNPVYLDADLTRLAQVFSNLLNNSAKYTLPGGWIRLKAIVNNGQIEVQVKDSGIGIPTESLPNIFDMFSQVDRSIERSTGGLGIGLALVRGLIEMHGGTVSAASEGLNQGSEFTVQLPLAEAQHEIKTFDPKLELTQTATLRRVLVVDDNRDSAESMALVLKHLKNDVTIAYNGLDAIERAESLRPDLILMDIGMPQLNGYEATRRIRERPWSKATTIIALTGWGQEEDRARTKEAGCDGHLVKPVSIQDLQLLLNNLK